MAKVVSHVFGACDQDSGAFDWRLLSTTRNRPCSASAELGALQTSNIVSDSLKAKGPLADLECEGSEWCYASLDLQGGAVY